MLEHDGCVVAQSMTIARFLAKKVETEALNSPKLIIQVYGFLCLNKAGLAGKSDLDQAHADMIADSVNDVQVRDSPTKNDETVNFPFLSS